MLGSGLRHAEIRKLRPCDVRDGVIYVLNGKGHKNREYQSGQRVTRCPRGAAQPEG